MKILMSADTIGGVWTYALELARALRADDVQIALATMGRPLSDDQWQAVSRLPNITVFESDFKLEWMDDPWDDLREAGRWLQSIAALVQPDLIHFNHFAHGALEWNAPLIIAGHSCVLSWWQAVHQDDAPPRWDQYREVVRSGLRGADVVLAPSAAMLRALKQYYGPFQDGRVIYNARHAQDFPPGRKCNILATAGRLWDKGKNVAALEHIAADLPWPVVAAGEMDMGGSTQSAVRYLGQLSPSQLARWMGRASIYVLPARYEPFGLTALEAAYAGCALVLGDIPSLREIWQDAAIFVPPDRPEVLHSALLDLIAHPERRAILAARAALRARRFNPQQMMIAYKQVYAQLTRRSVFAAQP